LPADYGPASLVKVEILKFTVRKSSKYYLAQLAKDIMSAGLWITQLDITLNCHYAACLPPPMSHDAYSLGDIYPSLA